MRKVLIILLAIGFILSCESMAISAWDRNFVEHLFGKVEGDLKTLVETGQGWCVVHVQFETIDSRTLTWKDKCRATEYWAHKAKQVEVLKRQ